MSNASELKTDEPISLYEEQVVTTVIVVDGRPAIQTSSQRRQASSKVKPQEHVEHLVFKDPEHAMQIAVDLYQVSKAQIDASATEQVQED